MSWRKVYACTIAPIICLAGILFFMGGWPCEAGAAVPVQVYVNGRQAAFPDVKPVIVDGRTMVPLRFVAEAPSFGAVVFYDDALHQVTLVRGANTVNLWPSSRTVLVDGRSIQTDVAPVIIGGRTMVPLRFLSETFGATVTWNGSTATVGVAIAPAPRLVMGYYYGGSYDEFLSRHASLTEVAFHWYEVDGKGNLLAKTPDSYRLAVDYADQNRVRTEASVSLFDSQKLHLLLGSATARKLLVENLAGLARQEGYRCINLDLESVAPGDRDGYLALLKELSQALRSSGIGFVVAVPAMDSEKSWYAAYDYAAIASYADRIVLMAYEYHYRTGPPGAVAPYGWVVNVIDYAEKFFTPQQIYLGIALHGYDWPEGKDATSITSQQAEALAASHNAQPVWDNDVSAPHFSYTGGDGIVHQVWYENRPSLKMKLGLARSRGLAGISIWRLGCGFPQFWDDVKAYQAP